MMANKAKVKKEEKLYDIIARLPSAYYSRVMEVKGTFTEGQVNGMKDNIGRDCVIQSPNNSFNLKYFDSIIFDKQEEVVKKEEGE